MKKHRDTVLCVLVSLFVAMVITTAITSMAAPTAICRAETAPSQLRSDAAPQWIWGGQERRSGQAFLFRRPFTVAGSLRRARIRGAMEYCHGRLMVNQESVAGRSPYGPLLDIDLSERLQQGENTIVLQVKSVEGPAAVFVCLELEYADGRRVVLVSDSNWQTVADDAQNWPAAATVLPNRHWRPASLLGAVAAYPWRVDPASISINTADDYTQWKRALDGKRPPDVAPIETPPGFKTSLVYSSREGEGSWVSLAPDAQGRWIIAKEKRGLLRLTLPAEGNAEVGVETINDQLAECRGLLFAHGALYAMANVDKSLYRLRDANHDDEFEEVTKLARFEGGDGHGRNQIALGPDGRIYCIMGDSIDNPYAERVVPTALKQPNRFEAAASGMVVRLDADGGNPVVVVRGLRNPFGLDFNAHGDMFTYDADAEYDTGASWYRPTRINHLAPGADFLWRRVTQQWPPYFPDRPDMPRPLVDIGKGSPTAVVFGAKSNFPAPYKRALFALDWTYGRILAVHLAPRGGGYMGAAEVFLRGRPLNVTDADFGPDGAMYFITGGRGTQSSLYRVEYVGENETPPSKSIQQESAERFANASRDKRRRLEARFDQQSAAALNAAWPFLADADPAVQLAARVVLEKQNVSQWRARALTALPSKGGMAALLALFRAADSTDRPAILARLQQLDLSKMDAQRQWTAVFLYRRCLESDIAWSKQQHQTATARLDAIYPARSFLLNRELSLALAPAGGESFVKKTMSLLAQARNATQRFHYLYVLRNEASVWAPGLRQRYFAALSKMDDFIGGEGMPAFKELIRNEALAAAPANRRAQFQQLLTTQPRESWRDEIVEPPKRLVREWTVQDLRGALPGLFESGRDFKRGRVVFLSAKCVVCHRVGREGGVSGPDLTGLAGRYTPHDLLQSILEPSLVISEKYRHEMFALHDGRVITGRAAPGDYRLPDIRVVPDLLEPGKVVTFSKQAIETRKASPVSPMPADLLNHYSREDILDLLAYVLSDGGMSQQTLRR